MSSSLVQGETVLPAGGSQPKQLTTSAVGGSLAITALTGNSGTVYVGNSSVTSSDGFAVAAGGTLAMDIIDASRVYLAGTQNDKVRFIVVGP